MMFESVLFPAPFSPSSACTSPTAASKSTRSFASTPGKCFVIPCILTAGTGEAPDGPAPLIGTFSSGASRKELALRASDHALDEEVHRVALLDGHHVSLPDPQLAALVVERPLQRGELAGDDRLFLGRDRGPGLGGHRWAERGNAGEAVLQG